MTQFYFQQNGAGVDVHFKSDVSVNAWNGQVVFGQTPQDLRIISADSISTIWQTAPQLNGNAVIFTGGTPNGFTGDGVLFRLVLAPGSYNLSFASGTAAYLNDGFGTAVAPTLSNLTAMVSAATSTIDNVPPEPFLPVLYQNKDFFNGQEVVIFSTKDLESGINHYEVKEITTNGAGDWHLAQSPYLVQNDVRVLEIKAVDNFGNSRVETLNVRPGTPPPWFISVILAVLVCGALVLYNIKRWRKAARK